MIIKTNDRYAVKCDQCGQTFHSYLMKVTADLKARGAGWRFVHNDDSQEWEDMCPTCYAKLKEKQT